MVLVWRIHFKVVFDRVGILVSNFLFIYLFLIEEKLQIVPFYLLSSAIKFRNRDKYRSLTYTSMA